VARDRLILALADALQIAPSELMTLPVPAPGNGPTDGAINAVRLALLAVGHNRPGGEVQSVETLRARVAAVVDAYCQCDRNGVVGAALPGVIRDLHTSITSGRDVAELLDLAVLLHSHATVGWLRVVGGSLDLRSQAADLARRAAIQRETPQALGLAAWGGMYVLAELLTHSRRDAVGRELRGMAYRAGLPGAVTKLTPRNRKVLHATCSLHGGPVGFTNVVVSKRDAMIVFDPHVTGACVLTLAEDEAVALRDTLSRWLG
jgi:hypothetical protein